MSTIGPIPAARREHLNRLPFTGVLTHVETPSDKAPNGARGHRVVLARHGVEEALWSLVGMGIDYSEGYESHNAQQKCGIIEEGHLEGDELHVSGYLFARDFPMLVRDLRRPGRPMGMSYELAEAHVESMTAEIWRITKMEFTGAAILYADRAAYSTTTFNISASDEPIAPNGKLVLSFSDAHEVTGVVTLRG